MRLVMENNFNNRDFEQFVKQNADQYRMFPSEKVWNGIHNTLHTRRRWYGIGLSLLLLTTGVVTWVMLNSSAKERQVVSTLPEISSQPVSTIPLKTKAREVVIAPVRNNAKNASFITSPERLQQNLYIADNSTTPVIDDNSHQDNSTDAVAYINAPAANIDSHIPEIPVLKTKSSPAREVVTNKSINTPAFVPLSIAGEGGGPGFKRKL